MTPEHLAVCFGEGRNPSRVRKLKDPFCWLCRLPLLTIFWHQETEFALVVDNGHVRGIIEEDGVRCRSKEQFAGFHSQRM